MTTVRGRFDTDCIVLPEQRNRLERVKSFPGDALRIDRPIFVRSGVAALRSLLLGEWQSRVRRAALRGGQFIGRLDLNAQMIQTGRSSACRDREIHTGILQQPFGIIGFAHARFGLEQCAVEMDVLVEVIDRDVDMQSFRCVCSALKMESGRQTRDTGQPRGAD